MKNKEIEKILNKCDNCKLSECINCEMSYADRKKIREYIEKIEEENYWKGYIQKQNEAMEICKQCKYRKKARVLEIVKGGKQ